MGKQNEQRRAAKKRRREETARRRATGRAAGGRHVVEDSAELLLEELVAAAVAAVGTGRADSLLDALAATGRPGVVAAGRLLEERLARVHGSGWSSDDLVHVVTRRLSGEHAAVAVRQPLAEPLPVRQALRLHVELLALLGRLPAVPATGRGRAAAPPRGLDARVLARVRGLLAKAESTDFPEEAEALTAKAQELIARHAIDAVLLHHDEDPGRPASRRVYIDDPYVDPKAALLDQVASANRCRAVQSPAFAWSTVFGYDADLDAVELLTASLLAQATRAMARLGSRVDASGRSRTRSFRRSFLVGFAHRIGERLRETTDGEVAAAGACGDTFAGHLLPVLAARDVQVQSALAEAFPEVVGRATSISNAAGWAAGESAANAADLSLGAGMLAPRARH